MSTPSSSTHATEGGVPVNPALADGNQHPLVRITSMYGVFVLESVQKWLEEDAARQEAETPDTMDYLTGSMRFLMDAIERQQKMGELCGIIGKQGAAKVRSVESQIPVLRSIGVATKPLEDIVEGLRTQSTVLNAFADTHAGNADYVVSVMQRLEPRIHAALTGKSAATYQARPN